MTCMPASRRARATTLMPRSWPSRPTLARTTRMGAGEGITGLQGRLEATLSFYGSVLPRPRPSAGLAEDGEDDLGGRRHRRGLVRRVLVGHDLFLRLFRLRQAALRDVQLAAGAEGR